MKRLSLAVLSLAAALVAMDPCGMVPPISTRDDPERYLTRTGDQLTYVFFRDGIEDVVLRPAFEGRVDEFGMLIPFPTPPAIRKVNDDIFYQVGNAVEPPTVVIELGGGWMEDSMMLRAGMAEEAYRQEPLSYDTVRVLNEEAVGMYVVAVLEAGSAHALEHWMTENGYIFPGGMAEPAQDYVEQGWCFVAVKARVGRQDGVDPRPGMRSTDPTLPSDATFTGAVQAMGFRFHVEAPVVPMRLAGFNPGPLHNIVYMLTDTPVRPVPLDESFVRERIAGDELLRNMTEPLPAVFLYYTANWSRREAAFVRRGEQPELPAEVLQQWQGNETWWAQQRDPAPYNAMAMELIASDLLAAREDRLIHDFEEDQKVLLDIGEELGLRGPHIDALIHAEMRDRLRESLGDVIQDLRDMTMTVIEGDLPREVIRENDLTFEAVVVPEPVVRTRGEEPRGGSDAIIISLLAAILVVLLLNLRRKAHAAALLLAVATVLIAAAPQDADVAALADPARRPEAVEALVARGAGAVAELSAHARAGDASLESRGWAMVCLARIGHADGFDPLRALFMDAQQRGLLRTWAAGAMAEIDAPRALEAILSAQGNGTIGGDAELTEAVTRLVTENVGPAHAAALVQVCLRGEQQARYMAASYLGHERINTEAARAAYIEAVAYDPEAVPWAGGPLYIPGIAWPEPQARDLIAELTHWLMWADGHSANDAQILRNNLPSIMWQYIQDANVWNGVAAQYAIAWVDRWAAPGGAPTEDEPVFRAGASLLVHALETGAVRSDVLARLRVLAGEDVGDSVEAWRGWLESLDD